MKIPRKLKIGAYDYQVKRKKNLRDNGIDLYGLCDRENKIIYLDSDLDVDRKREVLLHECLHAMEDVYDITLGEKKVNMLGMALLAFFKDNKIKF